VFARDFAHTTKLCSLFFFFFFFFFLLLVRLVFTPDPRIYIFFFPHSHRTHCRFRLNLMLRHAARRVAAAPRVRSPSGVTAMSAMRKNEVPLLRQARRRLAPPVAGAAAKGMLGAPSRALSLWPWGGGGSAQEKAAGGSGQVQELTGQLYVLTIFFLFLFCFF
jgi:hypothetical protein